MCACSCEQRKCGDDAHDGLRCADFRSTGACASRHARSRGQDDAFEAQSARRSARGGAAHARSRSFAADLAGPVEGACDGGAGGITLASTRAGTLASTRASTRAGTRDGTLASTRAGTRDGHIQDCFVTPSPGCTIQPVVIDDHSARVARRGPAGPAGRKRRARQLVWHRLRRRTHHAGLRRACAVLIAESSRPQAGGDTTSEAPGIPQEL